MGLGADDYITKPFDDTELLEAIEIRLKKSERIGSTFDNSEEGLQRFFSEAKANQVFENISTDKEIRTYKKKDNVYKQDQKARWLYFVVSGQVKEYQVNEYGKELTHQLYNEGEFFGYYPLISESNYKNFASCTEDTSLRLIPKEDFSNILFNNRDFAAHFIKMLANRAEDTEKLLIEMAYSSVRKKVANALLAFATEDQRSNNEAYVINTSRDDLAALAGTAKETLIRTLSDFKSDNLIEVEAKTIKVNQVNELKNLIG